MESTIPAANTVNIPVAKQAFVPLGETVFDDPALLELAKQRIAVKRSLMGQSVDFVLFFIPFIVTLTDPPVGAALFVFPGLYWAIRLTVRTVKFYRPEFKNGVRAYLQKRRQLQLEFEYNRLKAMNAEATANMHPR